MPHFGISIRLETKKMLRKHSEKQKRSLSSLIDCICEAYCKESKIEGFETKSKSQFKRVKFGVSVSGDTLALLDGHVDRLDSSRSEIIDFICHAYCSANFISTPLSEVRK